ncbi:hypothetical protein [Aliiglaciecola sp. LCG003]|uniref:hypothetical protein n=1 Tax=Aliiglaciecola sp. LCG003 TaxID=3053655 RepID=UPI00257280F8|nr:hypothetical protein [Aliiglaciecola sp. LCG003]WJG08101.1 hypothetical protein QR722_12180 [Aliiglaciecola sp. LCG003]
MKPSVTPKTGSLLEAYSKQIFEYPLPKAKMTHEIAVVNDGKMVVISQMDSSTLVQIDLDNMGRPINAFSYQIGNQTSGLHGVSMSTSYLGDIWVTLQNDSELIRLTPGKSASVAPQIQSVIQVPKPGKGPHCVSEFGEDLWFSCKDPSDDTGDYYVCRINKANPNKFSLWRVPKSPVFVMKHPKTGDVYASIDSNSKIARCKNSEGAYCQQTIQNPELLEIPSEQGSTVVGMCIGPDENPWFVLLGGSGAGTGTFGRILPSCDIEFVQLTGPLGAKAGLLHITFAPHTDGESYRAYILSSDITKDSTFNQPNALFDVTLDSKTLEVLSEVSFVFPTQYSWAHRVFYSKHGLYCTQLRTSGLVHIIPKIEGNKPQINEGNETFKKFGMGINSKTVVYV